MAEHWISLAYKNEVQMNENQMSDCQMRERQMTACQTTERQIT